MAGVSGVDYPAEALPEGLRTAAAGQGRTGQVRCISYAETATGPLLVEGASQRIREGIQTEV